MAFMHDPPEGEGAVNRAIEYIQTHLADPLVLREIACAVALSESRLSRLFKAMVGETVYGFIKRLRLEKAAALLRDRPALPIGEVAFLCGFETQAAFSKGFRSRFGIPPSAWRSREVSLSAVPPVRPIFRVIAGCPTWRYCDPSGERTVVVRTLAPMPVAYRLHKGPYKGNRDLFEALHHALCLRLPETQGEERGERLNVYYDDPSITKDEDLRVMAAIALAAPFPSSPKLSSTCLPGGRYGLCRFRLAPEAFASAWEWMATVWLPQSGYTWDDRPSFECFVPPGGEEDDLDVEIGIPIRPKG